jgi:integrase/recombinase XerD
MRASGVDLSAAQLNDINNCVVLWRKIGLSSKTVSCYRYRVGCLLKRTGVADYGKLSADVVEHESRSYARQIGVKRLPAQRQWMSAFRAFSWALNALGKAGPAITPSRRTKDSKEETDPVVSGFRDYGRQLGWTEGTWQGRYRWLRFFRSFQHRRHGPWLMPRLRDIDRFLQSHRQRWAQGSIIQAAGAMRAWLRFLYITGRSKTDLSPAVMNPIQRPFAQPARTLPWPTVRRLACGIDRSTPRGRRDYAQYLLLCAYGLGPSELVDLKLEDIDWQAKILRIRRRKTRVAFDLPLLPPVARALAAYIRHGRPPTSYRHVFLSHHIPFAPLHPIAVTDNVGRWAARSKIDLQQINPRMLRHSHATRQLEHDVPLKIIGDILGHQDSLTTSRYVRSAVKRLRQIALPVPR